MSGRKSVIVDGPSLLSTCYYAVSSREITFAKTEEERQKHYDKILHSENGVYTNGIFGMLKTTASLLKEQVPDHIAFVFDRTRNIFRRKLCLDYKGIRSATPEPLEQQFVLFEQILGDAGLQISYDSQFEVDDCAGSLVVKFRDQTPMVVTIKDHGYFRLVSDKHNVGVWMVRSRQEKADKLYNKYYVPRGLDKRSVNLPEKTFEFTAEHVFAEGGVWPCQVTGLKGIQGDTSNNIPEIKGVVSAVLILLNKYKSVKDFYEIIHDVKENRTALKELQDLWKNDLGIGRSPYKALTKTGEGEVCGKAVAMLFERLVTIKISVQIDLSLGDFSVSYHDESRMEEWRSHLDIKEEFAFGR